MGISDSETIIEEQFPVGDSPTLFLDTVSGRVTIRRTDERFIRVRARKYGRQDAVDNTRIEFSTEGEVLKVHTRGESRRLLGGDKLCSVDFEVSVPSRCRLQVETVSAGVDIREVGGIVHVQTVSGGVFVNGTSEPSSIRTVSGGVTGESLAGTLRLETVSGSSHVTNCRLSEFEVESVSGSIELETALLVTGSYRAHTVSGAIRLQVPEGTGLTLRLETVSGRVHAELPSTVERVGFGTWRGDINGGGVELHLKSVSGNVTIAETGAPVPA